MTGLRDSLCKMQRHACLWITSAFETSPISAAETLAGMPPIHLHVKKLVEHGSCPPLADFVSQGSLALQGFVSCSPSPSLS
jgi:hypothetical protein